METQVERRVQASAQTMYELVARVEDWPHLLPHYRSVQILQVAPDRSRTVEMAARRDVLSGHPWSGIPLRWTAIQTLSPEHPRVEFQHVRGPTRGMRVAWIFEPQPNGEAHVRLYHAFHPDWPVPDHLVRLIIGEYFINGVARRTLTLLAKLAEISP
jgi:aromatase